MNFIALDPGTTTGIAVFDDELDKLDAFQIGPEEHHSELYSLLNGLDPAVVISERFQFRPVDKNRQRIVLDSREYIGVAKLYCQRNRKPFVLQTPAEAKGFWTDDKIRKLDLWIPSHPHAMDATRHLLYYWMRSQGNMFIDKLKGNE
jgi:hypothetical protein